METTPSREAGHTGCAVCEMSEDLIADEIAADLIAHALANRQPAAELRKIAEVAARSPYLAGAR